MPDTRRNSRSSRRQNGNSNGNDCSICMSPFYDEATGEEIPSVTLACTHKFHASCIREWATTRACTCPLCRDKIVDSSYDCPRVCRVCNRAIGEDEASFVHEDTHDDTTESAHHIHARCASQLPVYLGIVVDDSRNVLSSTLRLCRCNNWIYDQSIHDGEAFGAIINVATGDSIHITPELTVQVQLNGRVQQYPCSNGRNLERCFGEEVGKLQEQPWWRLCTGTSCRKSNTSNMFEAGLLELQTKLREMQRRGGGGRGGGGRLTNKTKKRLRCKNGDALYKGDEPSPMGRGYCARYEAEGVQKKGKDSKMWVVVRRSRKDGKAYKAWARASSA